MVQRKGLARGRGTQGPRRHAAGFEPEKGAVSKGVWVPPEPGMQTEPPGAGRPHLDFGPVRPKLDLWPPEQQENERVLF